jgi:hypothetical protein
MDEVRASWRLVDDGYVVKTDSSKQREVRAGSQANGG